MTDRPSMEGYGQWAEHYRRAMWVHVLPLPPRAKTPPPGGYTGRKADKTPDDAQIDQWVRQQPGGNLCLRMPGDVIGIDVDDYEYEYHARDPETKAKLYLPDGAPDMRPGVKTGNITLGGLEDELGPLPATWRSSSRGDGPSGIRFYRVPSGLLWGDFGEHLEAIWWGHRYAVVWPSVNPDSNMRYLWIDETEGEDAEWGCPPPKVTDLPDLPESWVARFGRPADTVVTAAQARRGDTAREPRRATGNHAPGAARQFTREQAARYVEEEALQPLRAAAHGSINNQLNNSATVMSHFVPLFWDHEQARVLLWDAAQTAGYDHRRSAYKTIDSGLATVSWVAELVSEPARPPGGARTRPRDHEDDGWPTEAPDDTPPEAAGFWDAHPALRYTHDFAVLHSRNPWGLLGTVLARVIANVEPNIHLPGPPTLVGADASLNMFVALVGPSGGGKSVTAKVARKMLDVRFGREPVDLFEAPLGSGEGLAHIYMRHPPKPPAARKRKGEDGGASDFDAAAAERNGIFAGPIQYRTRALVKALEIDALEAIGDRRGSTLSAQLRTAWDADELGFFYASPEKRLPVPEGKYRMCLLLGVQPARARGLMDQADGGLPQRFLWVPVHNPGLPEYDEEAEEEADGSSPEMPPLEWCPPVYSGGSIAFGACWAVRHEVKRNARKIDRGEADALDAHSMLTRLKAAAGLAMLLGETPATQTMLDEQTWELSGALMAVSDRTRAGVQRVLAETAKLENEKKGKAEAYKAIAVAEAIENDGVKKTASWLRRSELVADWCTEQLLRSKMGGSRKKHLAEAIDALIVAGQMESREYTASNGTTAREVRRVPPGD